MGGSVGWIDVIYCEMRKKGEASFWGIFRENGRAGRRMLDLGGSVNEADRDEDRGLGVFVGFCLIIYCLGGWVGK